LVADFDTSGVCFVVGKAGTWRASTTVQLHIVVLSTKSRQSVNTVVRPESQEDRRICFGEWRIPSKSQTNRKRYTSIYLFVCCVRQGHPSYGRM